MGSDKIVGRRALRIMVGFSALTILLLAGSAGAATLTVNAKGGAEYMRIQDAINNASEGDTILVYSGTYYENVNVSKQLILRGIDNGGGKPIVNAYGIGNAITLSAGSSTVEGLMAVSPGIGTSYGAGIHVMSNNNVIRNNTALYNRIGINLEYSSNNTLNDNTVNLNEMYGISLRYSNNNTLSGNNASYTADRDGFYLFASNNNVLINNTASSNMSSSNNGISLSYSNNNTIRENIASSNTVNGFNIGDFGNNNTLIGNIAIMNNYTGIYISTSNHNILSRNNASRNSIGISLHSANNVLTNNIMSENKYNFRYDLDFDNFVDTSNTVNGKSIYLIKGGKNVVYDSHSNAGTFICIDCLDVTLKDMNLDTNYAGIIFRNTTFSKIQNITASNNYYVSICTIQAIIL